MSAGQTTHTGQMRCGMNLGLQVSVEIQTDIQWAIPLETWGGLATTYI